MTDDNGAGHASLEEFGATARQVGGAVEDMDVLLAVARGVRAMLAGQRLIISRLPYNPGDRFSDSRLSDADAMASQAESDLDRVLEAMAAAMEQEATPLAGWCDELEPDQRRAIAEAVRLLMYWQDGEGLTGVAAIAGAVLFTCGAVRPGLGGVLPAPADCFAAFLTDCDAIEQGYVGEGRLLMRTTIRALAIIIAAKRGGPRLASWFAKLADEARAVAARPEGGGEGAQGR